MAFVFINSNAYNINITLLDMYQILFVFPAITKGNTCHEMKKVSALVKGFGKI
jgi:hypothetical protein